jgi:hypothetical protein
MDFELRDKSSLASARPACGRKQALTLFVIFLIGANRFQNCGPTLSGQQTHE